MIETNFFFKMKKDKCQLFVYLHKMTMKIDNMNKMEKKKAKLYKFLIATY